MIPLLVRGATCTQTDFRSASLTPLFPMIPLLVRGATWHALGVSRVHGVGGFQ